MRQRATPPPLLLLLFAALALLSAVAGLQANLAGVVDWHRAQVGAPLLAPTPPSVVSTPAGALWVAVTEANVLAAIDSTGAVAWRQVLGKDDKAASYHVCPDGSVLLLSSNAARLFDLATGNPVWERDIAAGSDAAFVSGATVVLSAGKRVTKINDDGSVAWDFEFPASDTVRFTNVAISGGKVYVLAETSGFAKPSLSHIVLDLEALAPTDLSQIPSSLAAGSGARLVVRSDGTVAAVWLEAGRIRSAELKASGGLGKTSDTLPEGSGRRFAAILDSPTPGFVLAQEENGAVSIVNVNTGAKVVGSFEGSRNSEDHTGDVYGGARDKAVFTRVYYAPGKKETVVQTISLDAKDKPVASQRVLTYDEASHGSVKHVAADASGSIVLTTASGAVQSVSDGSVAWTREESLADVVDVRFVDLGEPELDAALETLLDETFVGRVARQISDLRKLPAFAARFAQRLSSADVVTRTPPLSLDRLHRDQFGLQKLLVAVTRGGKVFGLDSANGNVLWSRNLGLFTADGPEIEVHQVHFTRNLSEVGNPQVAVIAARTRDGNTATVGYHVDAFTGEVAGDVDEARGVPAGKEIFAGAPKQSFLTNYINCCTSNRVLAVIDSKDQLHIFPKCKKVADLLQSQSGSFFYSRLDDGRTLRGFSPAAQGEGFVFTTNELWTRSFKDQKVLASSPVAPSSIASFGRALGDKSVLYKYLNPHLSVVTTLTPATATGHVYVIDTTTGTTVYEVELANIVGENVNAALVENWLVYTWLEGPGEALGGWRLGSVELYEDGIEQSAGRSTLATVPKTKALSASFILDTEATALAFTTSQYGVTTKDVVYLNSQGQVASYPRSILDPRRPKGKPTAAEKEEGIMPYEPILRAPASFVVSHKYPVAGLEFLTTAPTLLESTGLVFAGGLDLFCSRSVQPSGTFDILGDGFNKLQLLVTLGALAVGCVVAAPAVSRKALNMKWF
ncbi:ER membrane protein complex subunit 1 [Vanrija pseudolonga]|uniref:ER membrane protein complex subunit 1 n=1 Tax=Vanrija pseudolonga TaxID=143232 RepID=A0AAF1BNB3_9TREE|nr:ER membrane protein complex subunit 1 [Vanrija pseudolonga]